MKYFTILTAALGAISTLGVMLKAAGPFESAVDALEVLAFYFWAALPFLALMVLALFIFGRFSRAAELATLFTTLFVSVTSAWIYLSTDLSSSSTAGLIFVFVPFYALAASAVLYGISWLCMRSFVSGPQK